ncbi:MAG: hypothetical protein CVU36_14230 [Betaproteobacteria bacterium HGW-Betaproteobacteria-9]|jgi:HTH-type transcriptional regulator/antitoxin HigA|nr:MAG: hypothetical protein CVU36_14230 [Betaproteobacteria bacterium HGW-Betaproteobacteria-9]
MNNPETNDFEVTSTPSSRTENANRALELMLAQARTLPLKARVASGLPKDEDLELIVQLASEYAFTNPSALFRKRDDANEALIAFWLATVLKKARRLSVSIAKQSFKGLDQEVLRSFAKLSLNPDNLGKIQEILMADHSVILILERAYPSLKLDGAVAVLENGFPVIGVSLRYPRYDHFWFTLMHELAHVSLHYAELNKPIIDDFDDESSVLGIEAEANRYAADMLIPRRLWDKSLVHRTHREHDLLLLAKQAEVHPAIVAGMLRRRLGNYRLFSKIVGEIDVRQLLRE